jgi:phospholipid transport system substrate-binding protein
MLMHKKSLALPFSVLAVLVSTSAAATTSAAPTSPKPWMQGVVDRGTELAKRKVEPNTPGEAKWREETKALIDDTLDWPELTQQALGKQWEKLSAAEQKQFSAALREMIEASYQSKLGLFSKGASKKPAQVKIEWLEEKLEGDNAAVTMKVKTDKNVAGLELKAKHKDGRWRIWDVAIDEVSTVRTYRTQFGKIISKDGFPALMARIKAKVEDIRAGRADIGP